jgi:hypothetical protein
MHDQFGRPGLRRSPRFFMALDVTLACSLQQERESARVTAAQPTRCAEAMPARPSLRNRVRLSPVFQSSPLLYVGPETPPTLQFVGGHDLYISRSGSELALHRRLREAVSFALAAPLRRLPALRAVL